LIGVGSNVCDEFLGGERKETCKALVCLRRWREASFGEIIVGHSIWNLKGLSGMRYELYMDTYDGRIVVHFGKELFEGSIFSSRKFWFWRRRNRINFLIFASDRNEICRGIWRLGHISYTYVGLD
jgi:hypothetical protein